MTLPQLRRVRWAVRAALLLSVAASIAANVLHARHNPISQTIAAWPPLALLLNIELISRVPVHRRSLGIVRMAATTAIASIAAWVSYWHMAGVASAYGEQGSSPYLLPLSVDGLIVVASVSLVELAGRIRTAEHPPPSDVFVESKAAGQNTPHPSLSMRIPPHRRPAIRPGAETTARPDAAFPGSAMSWPIDRHTPTNGTGLNGTGVNGTGPGDPKVNGAAPSVARCHGADTEPHGDHRQREAVNPGSQDASGPRVTASPGSDKAVSDRVAGVSGGKSTDAAATVESGGPDLDGASADDRNDYEDPSDEGDEGAARGDSRQEPIPEEVTVLLPAARAARQQLIDSGQTVNRDTLAAQLRLDGHAVGNARAGVLLNRLRREPSGGGSNSGPTLPPH